MDQPLHPGELTMLADVTPLIITYDEAPNIVRTLRKLDWAKSVLIIDSGSMDGTVETVRSFSNVEVVQHPFIDFANQCNFGLSLIRTSWVLSLDADYELSNEFIEELRTLKPVGTTCGYQAKFIYRIYGHPLRGSLYPARTVLYRKLRAIYRNEGHGHRVSIQGDVLRLRAPIYHDDRKPLARWFASQQCYAKREAEYLINSNRANLSRADRLRLSGWFAPIFVFFYTLLIKGCVLDGWPGWFYVLQRVLAETLISLEIIDKHLKNELRSG